MERADSAAGARGVRWIVGRRGMVRLYLVQTGVGSDSTRAVCREAFRRLSVDLAVSSGFACALIPAQVGDVLIGTEVMAHPGPEPGTNLTFPCFAAASAAACRAAEEAGLAPRRGGFVTVPRILWRAKDKRAMAGTGAIGLDMESAAIGAAAAEHRIPFIIVRAVSDLVDEDLPLDFNLFQGLAGWGRGLAGLVARPSRAVGLHRLHRQAAVAALHLTRFFEKFLDAQARFFDALD